MFDLEKELSPDKTPRIVEQQSQVRSLAQRQRDVYETHRHRTFAVAFYMTGSELEAEEVLTDTFVRAFESADEPDARGVDTAMVCELRERLPIDEVAEPVESSSTPGLGGRNVKRTELEEALKHLPPNERIVFLLRDVEGYPPEKVADLIEGTRQQVERTLFSARLRLRGLLAQGTARTVAAA